MHPSLRIEGTFLRSGLARRIFLMFCVAVVLPAATVFWLTYRAAARNAQEVERAAMRAESKHFALTVYERLQSAHAMLERVDASGPQGGMHVPLLEPFFTEVVLLNVPLRAGAVPRGLAAAMARLPLLSTTKLLVLPDAVGSPPRIVLISHRPGGEVVAGSLKASFLWGDPEELALRGRICVLAGSQRLSCVGEAAARNDGGVVIHDAWDLFLKARFAADSWRFAASRQAEARLAGHLSFLGPLAFGLLLLVLLLSSIEIRRILVPLEALLARIRSVSMTRSTEPLADSTAKDELGALTQTFGDMERRIHRQMGTLRTLSEVDHLILERIPVALVIDVVISRIQAIVDIAAIGVTTKGAATGVATRHFVRARGYRQTEAGESDALAPLPPEAYVSQAQAGQWQEVVPGPAFERHGARHALLLALGGREESRTWVALGCLPDEAPDEEALAEVRELAERIAVAMALEEHENLLLFQARHDPLTGLPNRLSAIETIAFAIERAEATGRGFATVFIDLDRFKSINDGLGHALGDVILQQAGERIRQGVGAGDFVARFGGDEFFVVLHAIDDPAGAARAATRIAAAFAEPIMAGGVELVVAFSAGIALYPGHGMDSLELIHNADVAMYRGKKAGGGRVEFFEEEMNDVALTRVQLENDLRLAIRSGQLGVHYQPRVDSRDGRMVGAEALARWTHPDRGSISPEVFIALAEECGLIEELGAFVLNEACRQLGRWKRLGLQLPLIAVNVSSHQLRSGNLASVVAAAVQAGGIGCDELEIEVTESLLVNDAGTAVQQLQTIRGMGTTVAIDDFGTGYSSLAYLTRLPVDTLKIDRSFLVELDSPHASDAVIRSIIALAQALDKKIVAEGVESMEQVAMLKGWGCHIIQGYVYHRPLTPEAMAMALAGATASRARPA
jgi:diguanylate cyclase (GGDEF)-like protein